MCNAKAHIAIINTSFYVSNSRLRVTCFLETRVTPVTFTLRCQISHLRLTICHRCISLWGSNSGLLTLGTIHIQVSIGLKASHSCLNSCYLERFTICIERTGKVNYMLVIHVIKGLMKSYKTFPIGTDKPVMIT